jgi:hypothetical protein
MLGQIWMVRRSTHVVASLEAAIFCAILWGRHASGHSVNEAKLVVQCQRDPEVQQACTAPIVARVGQLDIPVYHSLQEGSARVAYDRVELCKYTV